MKEIIGAESGGKREFFLPSKILRLLSLRPFAETIFLQPHIAFSISLLYDPISY